MSERAEWIKDKFIGTKWSWGLKYSIGNIVNDIVITMYGVR